MTHLSPILFLFYRFDSNVEKKVGNIPESTSLLKRNLDPSAAFLAY